MILSLVNASEKSILGAIKKGDGQHEVSGSVGDLTLSADIWIQEGMADVYDIEIKGFSEKEIFLFDFQIEMIISEIKQKSIKYADLHQA